MAVEAAGEEARGISSLFRSARETRWRRMTLALSSLLNSSRSTFVPAGIDGAILDGRRKLVPCGIDEGILGEEDSLGVVALAGAASPLGFLDTVRLSGLPSSPGELDGFERGDIGIGDDIEARSALSGESSYDNHTKAFLGRNTNHGPRASIRLNESLAPPVDSW
jgi:hypothetical protein